MKQTFISAKTHANGYKKFIILDTEEKTYQTGKSGSTSLSWRSSELVIKVSSIKAIVEDLEMVGFTKK